MAQYSRIQVIQKMEDTGMVPLFYHEDISVAKDVLKACYDGGLPHTLIPEKHQLVLGQRWCRARHGDDGELKM